MKENIFFTSSKKIIKLPKEKAFNLSGNLKRGFVYVAENDDYEHTVNRLILKPLGWLGIGVFTVGAIEVAKLLLK